MRESSQKQSLPRLIENGAEHLSKEILNQKWGFVKRDAVNQQGQIKSRERSKAKAATGVRIASSPYADRKRGSQIARFDFMEIKERCSWRRERGSGARSNLQSQ